MKARQLRMSYTVKGTVQVTVSDPDEPYDVGQAMEQLTRHLCGSSRIDPESVRFEWVDPT